MTACKRRCDDVVPFKTPTEPTAAQFVPLTHLTSREIPEGYTAHPVVRGLTIDGRDLVQGPTVIDYLAARSRISADAACETLKQKLEAGLLQAFGPAGQKIDAAWWQFATISPDGSAASLKALNRVSWFRVAARDVLKLWPPPSDWVATAAGSSMGPTRVDQPEVSQRIREIYQERLDQGRPIKRPEAVSILRLAQPAVTSEQFEKAMRELPDHLRPKRGRKPKIEP